MVEWIYNFKHFVQRKGIIHRKIPPYTVEYNSNYSNDKVENTTLIRRIFYKESSNDGDEIVELSDTNADSKYGQQNFDEDDFCYEDDIDDVINVCEKSNPNFSGEF